MIDINKHRFYLFQILKQIYSDAEISSLLGFKGGTALMFFYDLPRFSVDLDFNLLDPTKENLVFEKIRKIVLAHGKIHDEAKKFYGPILVLDYGMNERKLKVEISNRNFPDRYEIKNLMGQSIQVMVQQDLLAHKLCALLDRPILTNRDVFDIWFLLSRKTPVNPTIIETRMQQPMHDYLDLCITTIGDLNTNKLLMGVGDLLDEKMKNFVRNKLKDEVLEFLRFYQKYPITSI
jgi:predicted nucleotidyltransferase component of viral defense system